MKRSVDFWMAAGLMALTACEPAADGADAGAAAGGGTGGVTADAGPGGAGGVADQGSAGGSPAGGTGGAAGGPAAGAGGEPAGGTGGAGGAPVAGTGGAPAGGEPAGGAGGEPTGGAGGEPTHDTWRVSAHPCAGNRTDTLWHDPDGTFWAGCGSTVVGTGLYRSADGGQTWEAPRTRPNGFLDGFRVSSISRSADGLLYVAGTNTLAGQRVVSVDTSAAPYAIGEVLSNMNQGWNNMHVGTFRRSAAGYSVAESLTGTDLAFRAADDQPFQDGYGWWTGEESFQLLDLDEEDGQFYGCGSTIAQPPQVFLPARVPEAGFALDPVQLASGIGEYSGEMWGLDVDAEGIVVGGVNQDRDVGMIYTFARASGGDPYDAGAWTEFDVSVLPGLEDEPTWIRGVCRGHGMVIAVGELTRRNAGLVLESADEGVTFAVVTPEGAVPPVQRCLVLPDGGVAVVGAAGYFAVR